MGKSFLLTGTAKHVSASVSRMSLIWILKRNFVDERASVVLGGEEGRELMVRVILMVRVRMMVAMVVVAA